MTAIKTFLLACILIINSFADEPASPAPQASQCYFIPPKNWDLADPKLMSGRVKIGFLGKNKKGFSPSLNLAVEENIGVSIGEYLKIVKKLHEEDHQNTWRELGKVRTNAGPARLTQIDSQTEFGAVRILQLILLKEDTAYILTAAALKEEFAELYQDIQTAFRSITITANLLEAIPEPSRRDSILQKKDLLVKAWREKGEGDFQKAHWVPFQNFIVKSTADMGAHWQLLMLESVKRDLESIPSNSRGNQ